MVSIDRTAIVVKPGQRFLDWLHAADPTSADLTLKELQDEPTIYLIEERDDDVSSRKQLAKICGRIFEDQLDGWWREPSSWPKRRGLAEFERWFEWSAHSIVYDLCAAPIRREDF